MIHGAKYSVLITNFIIVFLILVPFHFCGHVYDSSNLSNDVERELLGNTQKSNFRYTRANENNLSPPKNLTASPGYYYITLTWEPSMINGSSDFIDYMVFRANYSGGEKFLKNVSGGELCNDDTVSGKTRYYYYVIAVYDNLSSEPSNEASTIAYSKPEPPQNLTAHVGNRFVNLTWQPPEYDGGTDIEYYKIIRERNVDAWGSIDITGTSYTISNTTFTFNDTEITNGNYYLYTVVAYNYYTHSDPINSITAFPFGLPEPPQLFACYQYNDVIELGWDPPSDFGGYPITRYRLYRSTLDNNESFYDSVSPWTTFYIDPDVIQGNVYYYYVTAVTDIGESLPSTRFNATILIQTTIPQPPINLEAATGDSYVELSWEPPLDDGGKKIISYWIYRRYASSRSYKIGNVKGDDTLFRDNSVQNDQTYYYYVIAINSNGESQQSKEVIAKPLRENKYTRNTDNEFGNSTIFFGLSLLIILGIIPLLIFLIRKRFIVTDISQKTKKRSFYKINEESKGSEIQKPSLRSRPFKKLKDRI